MAYLASMIEPYLASMFELYVTVNLLLSNNQYADIISQSFPNI